MGLADDFRGMFHGLLRTNSPSPEAVVKTVPDIGERMTTVEIDHLGQMGITINDDLNAEDLKAIAGSLRRAANFISHQSAVKRWAERHDIVEHD